MPCVGQGVARRRGGRRARGARRCRRPRARDRWHRRRRPSGARPSRGPCDAGRTIRAGRRPRWARCRRCPSSTRASTRPRTLSAYQSGSVVALRGLRALLEANPVARSVLHLGAEPRVGARHVVEERGAVPRRAGGHRGVRIRAVAVEQPGRVGLAGGRCGWRDPCPTEPATRGGRWAGDRGLRRVHGRQATGRRAAARAGPRGGERAGQLRVDRPARALPRGVRGRARGVRAARAGRGGRHRRPPAAQARGVRRRPLRGAQDGALRRRGRDRASSPSSSSSSARATSSPCATARPAPSPRCGAPSRTTSVGSGAARWRCCTR